MSQPYDFPAIRAMFLDFGIDPRAYRDMSLYELISMQVAHAKRGKTVIPTEKEIAEGLALRDRVLGRDPSVRLH